jgi:predicted secreted protein
VEPDRSFDEAANGQTVKLRLGDVLQLQLHEPRTSGFRWNVEDDSKALGHLKELKSPSEAPLPGALGYRRWQFTVERTGSSVLRFRLQRPWEAPNSGRVFELTISVAD